MRVEIFMRVRSGLTTKLSDSRRRAPVERRGDFQITRDSQTESAAAVRCSALVRPRLSLCSHTSLPTLGKALRLCPRPTPCLTARLDEDAHAETSGQRQAQS